MNSVADDIAVLEGWLTHSILPMLAPDGHWGAPDPAPLTAAEIRPVFERIAKLDTYKSQSLETATFDHKVITLIDGVVSERGVEGTPWDGAEQKFERGTE